MNGAGNDIFDGEVPSYIINFDYDGVRKDSGYPPKFKISARMAWIIRGVGYQSNSGCEKLVGKTITFVDRDESRHVYIIRQWNPEGQYFNCEWPD